MPWPSRPRSTHHRPRNPPRPILLPREASIASQPPRSDSQKPPRPESPSALRNAHLQVARRNRLRGEGRLWRGWSESIKSTDGHKNEINRLTLILPRFPVEKITNRCFIDVNLEYGRCYTARIAVNPAFSRIAWCFSKTGYANDLGTLPGDVRQTAKTRRNIVPAGYRFWSVTNESGECYEPLGQPRALPRSGVLVQHALGDAAHQFGLNLRHRFGGGGLVAGGEGCFGLLHEGPNPADAVAVDLGPARVAADALLRLRRVRHRKTSNISSMKKGCGIESAAPEGVALSESAPRGQPNAGIWGTRKWSGRPRHNVERCRRTRRVRPRGHKRRTAWRNIRARRRGGHNRAGWSRRPRSPTAAQRETPPPASPGAAARCALPHAR